MTQYRLPWLITTVAVFAAVTSQVVPYLKRADLVGSRFPMADGICFRAETIDLSQTTQLNLRYSLISDEGVELELVVDGKRMWKACADPLGVDHSWYEHTVKCALVDGQVVLHSNGTAGAFSEYRSLATGALIKRETFAKRPDPVALSQVPKKEEIQSRIDRFREQTKRAEPYSAPQDGLRGFTNVQSTTRPR